MRLRTGPVLLFAICAAAIIAGCGGGGGSAAMPGTVARPSSTSAAVTILIPKAQATASGTTHLHRATIPANTQSIGVIVAGNGMTLAEQYFNIATPPCTTTSSGYSCTFVINAVIGNDTVTIQAFSAPNGGGALLSSGTVTIAIVAGATPAPVTVSLGGVINSISLQITQQGAIDPYVPIGNAATLTVAAKDASGNTIVGNYDNPIALSLPSSSGIALSTTTVPNSTTAVSIAYSGGPLYPNPPLNPISIGASGDGQSASVTFYPQSAVVAKALPLAGAGSNVLSELAVDANGRFDFGFTSYGPSSFTTTFGQIDPSSGTVATASQPGLALGSPQIFLDAKTQSIWFGASSGLACLPSYNGTPVSMALPAPTATPFVASLAQDKNGNLWMSDLSNAQFDYAPVNGACSLGSATSIPYSVLGATVSPSTMIGDPTQERVWVADANATNADYFYVAPPSSATAEPLPTPSSNVANWATDSAGDVLALINNQGPGSAYFGIIPAGASAFNPSSFVATPNLPLGNKVYPEQMTTFSGPSEDLVGVALDVDAVALVNVAAPTAAPQLLFLPPPGTAPALATGIAFDKNGSPWTIAFDTTNVYVQHVILTPAMWNIFANPLTFVTGFSTAVGIGGGDPTLTFTVTCTGALGSCVQVSGYPRVIQVSPTSGGAGTLTVTDSKGMSQTLNVTVLTSPPPLPALAHPGPMPARAR